MRTIAFVVVLLLFSSALSTNSNGTREDRQFSFSGKISGAGRGPLGPLSPLSLSDSLTGSLSATFGLPSSNPKVHGHGPGKKRPPETQTTQVSHMMFAGPLQSSFWPNTGASLPTILGTLGIPQIDDSDNKKDNRVNDYSHNHRPEYRPSLMGSKPTVNYVTSRPHENVNHYEPGFGQPSRYDGPLHNNNPMFFQSHHTKLPIDDQTISFDFRQPDRNHNHNRDIENKPHDVSGGFSNVYHNRPSFQGTPEDNLIGDRFSDPVTPKCNGRNEFRCSSGECLPARMRCDNRIDCRDSTDELNCIVPVETQTPSAMSVDEKNGCVLPNQPDGGNYEVGGCEPPCLKQPGQTVPKNSIITYTCRDGYILIGNTISVCVNDTWYKPPTCQKTCSPLKSSSVDLTCTYHGGVVSCEDRIMPGTRATLECKQSYKLPVTNDPGYREISCLEDGLWDNTIFRCLPECGTAIAQGNPLVVNGFNAKVGVFPWHVGIYSKNPNGDFEQICGGTLISNNLVASAAHCFYDESTNKVREVSSFGVAGGKHYRSWWSNETYEQKSLLSEIELADRYIGARGNFAQDIALIKLKTPFELTNFIRPICLDWDNIYEQQQLQADQIGKAVGWGKTENGTASESLQEINLPFVPYDQCLSAVPPDFRGYITSDKFCAGYLNGTSLCEGDSGGGLCFQRDGIWYLRGIVSVSPVKNDSCDYNSYVGFTYVSSFRDWMRSIYVSS